MYVEVEAEAEKSHDVEEIRRNPKLLAQSYGENFPEEVLSV